jgi:hypothetical protein
MANWKFRIVMVDPVDEAKEEIPLPPEWEPFQADRGGAGGWVIYLRQSDAPGPPLVETPKP